MKTLSLSILAIALMASCSNQPAPAPEPTAPEPEPEPEVVLEPTNAIDMGMPVLWADRNIGATSPSDYGGLYAWGELAPKRKYKEKNYALCNGEFFTDLTKYNTKEEYGTVDNLVVLEPADDVATQTLGEGWRIPTQQECIDLSTSCTKEWVTIDGISGFRLTAKNGNSIFLPAAGYRSDGYWAGNGLEGVNKLGSYWTSDLCKWEAVDAMTWDMREVEGINYYTMRRFIGYSVRAVKDK